MHATLRKWLIGIGLLVLVVLTVLVAEWQYTLRRRDPRLDAIRAKLDETEPGWQLDDIVRRWNANVPPTEINVAEKVRVGLRLVPREFEQWKMTTRVSRNDLIVGERLRTDRLTELVEQLPHLVPAVEQFHRCRRFPSGGNRLTYAAPFPFETTFDDDILGRDDDILSWAILAVANRGHGDEAIDLCRTQLHLRRAYGDDPIGMARFRAECEVSSAIDNVQSVLGLTEPRVGLAELQMELSDTVKFLRSESHILEQRARFDQIMRKVIDGHINTDRYIQGVSSRNWCGNRNHGIVATLAFTMAKRHAKSNHATILEVTTAARDATKMSGPSRLHALRSLPFPTSGSRTHLFVIDFVEGIERDVLLPMMIEAKLQSMIAALASEQFRHGTGRWPESLNEIPRILLPQLPIDPFTDKPVLLRHFDKGILIYTVGKNGLDEHGRSLEPKDDPFEVGPGDDNGIALLNPTARARPYKNRDYDEPE